MSYGRRKIFTDATEITAANVIEEVNAAYLVHSDNRNETTELYRYYRNKTAIENKTKEVRESINNKVGEVDFTMYPYIFLNKLNFAALDKAAGVGIL